MEEKYIPKVCLKEGESESRFDGHIKLKKLDIFKYFEIAEKYGDVLNQSKDKLEAADGFERIKSMKPFLNLIKETEEFYLEVDLKRRADNAEFKSFTDLTADVSCLEILMDVMGHLLEGAAPEKK